MFMINEGGRLNPIPPGMIPMYGQPGYPPPMIPQQPQFMYHQMQGMFDNMLMTQEMYVEAYRRASASVDAINKTEKSGFDVIVTFDGIPITNNAEVWNKLQHNEKFISAKKKFIKDVTDLHEKIKEELGLTRIEDAAVVETSEDNKPES